VERSFTPRASDQKAAAQAHCIRKATTGFRAESGAKRLCTAVAAGRIVGRTALAVIRASAPSEPLFHQGG
jgi:hypothetical protein